MTEPTHQDRENAARRQEIAVKARREYDEAVVLTQAALGEGWIPRGRHMLVDKDEEDERRRTGGQFRAAATVYSARKGGVEKHFTFSDGVPMECTSVEEGFGGLYHEKHPTKGFEHRGQWIPYQRYSLYWAGFETDYRPKTAEQLAAAREKRQERAVEREAEAAPLFADLIREEGYVPKGRKR
jgi:hypothetical protein